MKFFVPACGDRITLVSPWTFTLYNESRNLEFARQRNIKLTKNSNNWSRGVFPLQEMTLPAGTVLECDRVYIRAFSKAARSDSEDFDSITWKVVGVKKQRFWAKLSDCNKIEFELGEGSSHRERALAADEAARSAPVKLDAAAIRQLLRNRGELKDIIERVLPAFEAHYSESVKIHESAYQAYVRYTEEENRRLFEERRRNSWKFSHGFAHYPSRRGDLTQASFMEAFLGAHYANCTFVKRPDGTHGRKFWWPLRNDTHCWGYSDSYTHALQGLSFVVVTDADDTRVLDIEVCESRATK